jgi:hypothetical protein
MFNVSLRIVDGASQKPLPVRLRICDGAGRTYAPLGRLAGFATERNEDVGGHLWVGREAWCYIDGACEVPLPAGIPLVIEARHGPEYLPLRQEVTLGPGQMALRLKMERFVDYRAQGWYSGDARCHFLSPHAALLEGMAEDLAIVNLLVVECQVVGRDGAIHSSLPNMVAFSGQQPALERNGHLVAVNTFHTHPVLGQLSLLHCHRPVFPLSFGGADQTDDWSLADWCDQCHRKKGLVVWSEPFRTDVTPITVSNGGRGGENPAASEAFAELILGRIDAVECTPYCYPEDEIYDYWSAGIRFALVGGSGKDSNQQTLGAIRTYAQVSGLGYTEWIEAVRAGRTFITSGPLLQLSVNGQAPGSVIDLAANETCVRVQARLDSAWPSEPLELLYNGRTVGHSGEAQTSAPSSAVLDEDLSVPESGWIAACCQGTLNSTSFAQTSPVFIRRNGKIAHGMPIAKKYFDILERTKGWLETVARFENPRRKEQLLAILKQAQQALMARLQ